jgi:UDP-N-acetyl-D-glucosamine dehydrogenase
VRGRPSTRVDVGLEDLARELGLAPPSGGRQLVCIQGLGFVGSAMAVAVADASDKAGNHRFNVVGVDLPTPEGAAKVDAINDGRFPIATADPRLGEALRAARGRGNLIAVTDPRVYSLASVALVDIPLDVIENGGQPTVTLDDFRSAIRTLGRHMPTGSLIVVETTVPPGTTERVAKPELERALAARGLSPDAVLLAHSYERVMPGDGYFDSIVNFWRAYAGVTPEAADACEAFLSQVVNVEQYPLTRLASTTASETAKVVENSYRATTIALMEEWGRFAEAVNIDLFEIIAAIRRRPTHSNIRRPGFGVGGYCLTKDPLLGQIAARDIFQLDGVEFPFSTLAVSVNRAMPLATLELLERALDGGLAGRKILLMGISYRDGVSDTRSSPSEVFVRAARERGAEVVSHDPLVAEWAELGLEVDPAIPSPAGFDAVVFAVPHPEYMQLDLRSWLGSSRPLVLDASDVLDDHQRKALGDLGCAAVSIGRGQGV